MKKLFVCFSLLMATVFLATNAKAQTAVPGTFNWLIMGQSFTCTGTSDVCFYRMPSPRERLESEAVELVSATKDVNGEDVKVFRVNDKSAFIPGNSTENRGPKKNQPLGRSRED